VFRACLAAVTPRCGLPGVSRAVVGVRGGLSIKTSPSALDEIEQAGADAPDRERSW